MKPALVVIDVQKGMFAGPDQPHEAEAVVGRIAALIEKARAAGTPIYFVQHDGGPSHPFHRGKPGFAFHELVAPGEGDDVTIKTHGSAFKNTDLDTKLRKAGIERLVIAGMQSEYCVDSAVRGAVERGYQVILAKDGHSTFDTKILKAGEIVAHENETLGGSYAELKAVCEIAFS